VQIPVTTKEILLDIIGSIDKDSTVKEVRRGIFWTVVVSRFCGLSSTMLWEHCDQDTKEEGLLKSYTDMMASELARLSISDNISEASLGVAAINSLIEIDDSRCIEKNAGDMLLEIGGDKNVSVIGHFPFTEDLKKVAKNLWVIEKRLRPGDYPEEDTEKYLGISDIVAISSTTLINHTLDKILKLCPENSIKILLGPTTPITDVLFRYGIDIISGSKVIDESTALKYISEGANFRQLKRTGAIKLVTLMQKDMLKRGGNEI